MITWLGSESDDSRLAINFLKVLHDKAPEKEYGEALREIAAVISGLDAK